MFTMTAMSELAIQVLNEVSERMTPAEIQDAKFLLSEREFGIVLQTCLGHAIGNGMSIPQSLLTEIKSVVDSPSPGRHAAQISIQVKELSASCAA